MFLSLGRKSAVAALIVVVAVVAAGRAVVVAAGRAAAVAAGRAAAVAVGQAAAVAAGQAAAVAHSATRALHHLHHLHRLRLLRQEDSQMPASKKAVRVAAGEQLLSEPEAPAAVVETPAAEAPVAEAAVQATSGPRLRVTLLKSGTGYKYDQKRTLAALGLRKLHHTVERPDNPCIRGMVAKVKHLVRVEEIGQA